MKEVYCANCGTRLAVSRKALPKFAAIINIVEYHECPDEPVEFDLTPQDVPVVASSETHNKFVQKLNQLGPPSVLASIANNKRMAEPPVEREDTSPAPNSILEQIRNMSNTIPARPIPTEDDELS